MVIISKIIAFQVKDSVHAEIAKLMSWSFKILQEGRFPEYGFYGEELPVNSNRGRRCGQPLAGRWKILGLQIIRLEQSF